VYPVESAPGGDYFVVEQILIRPRDAPESSPVIAIVDDDPLLTAEMCSYFHSHGYIARPYNTEATFRAALGENVFDGFIVDWLLETGTAEAIIQSIRQSRHGDAPILLLTGKLVTGEANEDEVARVIQQYDVKPFEKPARLNWVAVELARRLKVGGHP
jgi:DNA-binding response OmpR family regulator